MLRDPHRNLHVVVKGAVVFVACVVLATWNATACRAADESQSQKTGDEPSYRIRVVDSDGRPVAGVRLYRRLRLGQQGNGWQTVGPVKSDASGIARLPQELLYPAGDQPVTSDPERDIAPIYAIDESRHLVGMITVAKNEYDREHEVRMNPACAISGEAHSTDLDAIGRGMPEVRVDVLLDAYRYLVKMPLVAYVDDGAFELWLPPGKFLLGIGTTDTYPAPFELDVRPGQRETSLGRIDLAARKKLMLVGRPAPELRDVKRWKNSPPLALSDLRGKVVLLDFWGYWCVPCLQDMPELFDLHDTYAERGLVVIGVHDDSVETIADLDEKLSRVRNAAWNGRDIPFPVAIAGGGQTPIRGTIMSAAGTVPADYRILGWPTKILIDRKGNVVQVAQRTDREELRATIERLLDGEETSR